MRSRRRAPVWLWAPALVGALLAFAPIVYLIDQAGELGWAEAWSELWRQQTLDLTLRSAALALTVTVTCAIIGVTGAWLVVRTDLPLRRLWSVVLTLPLAVPSYVAAFTWISWRGSLAGFWGAVLVLTLVTYPYVLLPTMAALRRVDPAQEEVARTLGRSAAGVQIGIVLRQIRPAVAAGSLLVMLYALSDFGAVAAMRYEVFTWVIYGAYRAGFNPSRAAVLSLALVFLATVVVIAESLVRGSRGTARLGSGAPRPQDVIALGWARWPAVGLLTALAAAALGFPAWRLAHWASLSERGTNIEQDLAGVLGNTLWLATLATLAVLALALPIGVLAVRHRGRFSSLVERSTFVAHALPGIVVAIATVFIGIRVLKPWYQEVPLLVLAYTVLFLPLAVGSVRAAVAQLPIRLEEVARSLGRGGPATFARITLPLAAPGILAGACLVYLTTMKELPATLLLAPTGTDTLATRLWTFSTTRRFAAAAPYASILVVFAGIPAALLARSAIERTRGRVTSRLPTT